MMKNYFRSLFNRVNSETALHSENGDNAESFIALSLRMIKERPLEFLIPASIVTLTVVSCIVMGLVRHDTTHVISQQNLQENHAKVILAQINDINSQIQALQTSPQSPSAFKDSLVKINTDFFNERRYGYANE